MVKGDIRVTRAELNTLYWAFEDVASEIGRCSLRKTSRARVDAAVSRFRKAVISLGNEKARRARALQDKKDE